MLGSLSMLLAVVVLAASPSAAAADAAKRDERPAARAFADAALRAAPAIEAASAQLAAIGQPTSCDVAVPRARRAQVDRLAGKLATARIIAGFTRTVAPAMRQATSELDATKTHDRALRRGRAAWHDVRRDYATFAKHPARRVCRQVRAYVRNDFEHTRGTRRGVRAYRKMVGWDTTDIDRRLQAAVDRLVELGVPAEEAAAFAGGLG